MYKIKYLNKILRTVDNPCGHHLKYIIFKNIIVSHPHYFFQTRMTLLSSVKHKTSLVRMLETDSRLQYTK